MVKPMHLIPQSAGVSNTSSRTPISAIPYFDLFRPKRRKNLSTVFNTSNTDSLSLKKELVSST